MILATLINSSTLFAAGILLLTMTVLRIGRRRWQQVRQRNPQAEARRSLVAVEQSSSHRVRRMEVQLHEFEREVMGRVDTTMRLLDEVSSDAEREIVRLETLLQATQSSDARNAVLSPRQNAMICHLADAGYDVAEIADLVGKSPFEIAQALQISDGDQSGIGRADAA